MHNIFDEDEMTLQDRMIFNGLCKPGLLNRYAKNLEKYKAWENAGYFFNLIDSR